MRESTTEVSPRGSQSLPLRTWKYRRRGERARSCRGGWTFGKLVSELFHRVTPHRFDLTDGSERKFSLPPACLGLPNETDVGSRILRGTPLFPLLLLKRTHSRSRTQLNCAGNSFWLDIYRQQICQPSHFGRCVRQQILIPHNSVTRL